MKIIHILCSHFLKTLVNSLYCNLFPPLDSSSAWSHCQSAFSNINFSTPFPQKSIRKGTLAVTVFASLHIQWTSTICCSALGKLVFNLEKMYSVFFLYQFMANLSSTYSLPHYFETNPRYYSISSVNIS